MRRIAVYAALTMMALCVVGSGLAFALPAPAQLVILPPVTWDDVAVSMPQFLAAAESGTAGSAAFTESVTRGGEESFSRLVESARNSGAEIVDLSGMFPAEADEALAGLADGDRRTLVVAKPVRSRSYFAPFVVAGERPGLAYSASTRREGIVTGRDLTVTMRVLAGAVGEAGIAGAVIESREAVDATAALIAEEGRQLAVRAVQLPFQISYASVAVLAVVAAAAGLAARRSALREPGWLVTITQSLLLLSMSVPVATWLGALVWRWPGTGTEVLAAGLLASAVVWAVGLAVRSRVGFAEAAGVLGALTALVLLADGIAGAPLSHIGLLGYTPLLGARFYGLGNEAAGLMVGGAVLASGVAIDRWPDTAKWLPALAGVAVVGVLVAPPLGANIGVLAWGTVAFGVQWMFANRKRMNWRIALLAGAGITAAAVAIAWLDYSGGSPTHLGRLVENVASDGAGAFLEILRVKLGLNVKTFVTTPLPIIGIPVLVLLVRAVWWPRGVTGAVTRVRRGFASALAAGLIGGLVGLLSEDSGIAITGLVLLWPGTTMLGLAIDPNEGGAADDA